MSILTLSADDVLRQRWLFKPADGDSLYKELLKRWHPDLNSDPKAEAVVKHINEQWAAIKRGEYPNTLTIKHPNSLVSYYPYFTKQAFELGDLYICEKFIIWATRRDNDDLARRWLMTAKHFKFHDKEMESKVQIYIPRESHTVANDEFTYTIIARDKDYIRVADLLQKFGPLEPAHAAWIMSRAYNVCCYLQYARITHMDISAETMFIEPESHHGGLFGGWFYTGYDSTKPLAAPARTSHLVRQVGPTAHLSMVRAMGRTLLGVPTFSQLRKANIPEPMKSWLLNAGGSDPIKEYSDWKEAITKTFGARKFTAMPITTSDVYG